MTQQHSKKINILLGVLASALLLQAPAFATGDRGGYAGANIGIGNIDASPGDVGADTGDEDQQNDFAWRAYAGYRYSTNFAIEGGYTNWGTADINQLNGVDGANASTEQQSADLLGKLIFPLNSALEVYVKGGVSYVKASYHANSLASSLGLNSGDNTAIRPLFGLGSSYEFYPRFTADIAWLYLPSGGGIQNSNFYGVGIGYNWG